MFSWLKREPEPNGPDFSGIDSREKAEELFRRGELERLFLLPLEFGGEDSPLNMLYVPVGVAAIKSGSDNNVIGPLASEGKVSKYKAVPEYQGGSFIPSPSRSPRGTPASSPRRSTSGARRWAGGRTPD